jgi:CRP-like cAMP-binding protein
MTDTESLRGVISRQEFFHGMEPEHQELLAGCARNVRFGTGEQIFREGDEAELFYLIREGRIALELSVPGAPKVMVQSCGEGEGVGWSWLIGSHRWHYGGRAVQPTRALAFDGRCLRAKCEEDPRFGYELFRRVSGLLAGRLEATRMQLVDVYVSRE